MLHYAASNDKCRSMLLVNYFGEESRTRCGVCDVCLQRNKVGLSDLEFETISGSIKSQLSKGKISLEELVSKVHEHKEDKTLKVIEWLIETIRSDMQMGMYWNGPGLKFKSFLKRTCMKLDEAFYQRSDVVQISRELLGKKLVTKFDGKLTSGIIMETEAYAGITDRASHAYGGRRTSRTEYMYHAGGIAYVYLCWNPFSFNVVTNIDGIPHAILIRSVFPINGGVKEMFVMEK